MSWLNWWKHLLETAQRSINYHTLMLFENIDMSGGAVFTWVSKGILGLLWLCFAMLSLVPFQRKTLATFSSNEKQNQKQLWLACTCFPELSASNMCLFLTLIGSLQLLSIGFGYKIRHPVENYFSVYLIIVFVLVKTNSNPPECSTGTSASLK